MNTTHVERPWAALWALVLGFFMILVDTTIVSVAGPSIMQALDASITQTLWVTSAYLLAYAVPLLVTGRLGDRFGPRRIYLVGLAMFTVSSFACGMSPNVEDLIAARAAQGLGASMMTPQTMAVITRIFPPHKRGAAMGLWGGTAGMALLAGPILGGVLLDGFGWEWIFYVNIPVGVIGFVLALRYVPRLEISFRTFDLAGVFLYAVGMFAVVFAAQEGARLVTETDWGVPVLWALIGVGVVALVVFVGWQRVQRGDPLMPLAIFRDRNFSIGTAAIATMGFAITSMSLPVMFFFQLVRGFTPTESAMFMVPTALISGFLSPLVGKMIDSRDPRPMTISGSVLVVVSLAVYIIVLTPDTAVWLLFVPGIIMGFANAMMWGPLAAISTYQLPPHSAGAGSGVYNTSRQVGSVFGSAAITSGMNAFLIVMLGTVGAGVAAGFGGDSGSSGITALPPELHEGFASAMRLSLLIPAAVMTVGVVLTCFFRHRAPVPAERTDSITLP